MRARLTPPSFPQGRRVVLFDLSFTAKWEGTLLGSAGSAQTGDGEMSAADIDQACFAVGAGGAVLDVPVAVRAAEDGGAVDEALARKVREFGVPVLRARIAEVVAELRATE